MFDTKTITELLALSGAFRPNRYRPGISRREIESSWQKPPLAAKPVFRKTDLRGIRLKHCWFVGRDFRDAKLQGCNLNFVNFEDAEMSGAKFRHASLYNVSFEDADLYKANLRNTEMTSVNMCGTDLRKADLRKAGIADVFLDNDTSLAGAVLDGKRIATGQWQRFGLSPHDFTFTCIEVEGPDKWMVFAGCRRFTLAQAREHWTGDTRRGGRVEKWILSRLDLLEQFDDPPTAAKSDADDEDEETSEEARQLRH